jgi:DNA-binding CsgD family transcriptional regulator
MDGDVRAALGVASATHAMAVEAGSHDGMAALGCALGQAELFAGHARSAIARLREAATLLRELDRNRYLPWCLADLAHALVLAGEVDAARSTLEEAEQARTPGIRLFEIELDRAHAWLLAAEGDLPAARSTLLVAADRVEADGCLSFAVQALHDVVRLGDATVADRLQFLAARTDLAVATLAADHAQALLDDDGGALDTITRRFDALGADLMAAEASAEAVESHRRAGRVERAVDAASTARRLLERCEGARPPGLSLLPAEAPLLTAREREIALLAADGLASKAIADRLFVSVRTVDNHLHRVYDKLGVRNRAQLADLLGPSERG